MVQSKMVLDLFLFTSLTHFCVVPAEQGYDPFNPEVVRPQAQQNGKAGSGDLSGALEMVNRAIEEVRSEVEREKRKLSRIGDEPYDPSERTCLSSSDAVKSKTASSHMAYDPGSYQMTSDGYSPTPGCSKYTLDSGDLGNNSNSMEYVPTLLKKPSSRTQAHQLPSPPPSPKYSNSTSISKCKYTVDNSRPSTDMEYDPLSNYSAGIATKSKRDKVAQVVKADESKKCKLPGSAMLDEEYIVAVKKPRQQSIDYNKYTFSDSDGESSGTEYRPTMLRNLQQRKENSGTLQDIRGNERLSERTESISNTQTQRCKEDLPWDSDIQDGLKRKDSTEKKKMVSQRSHEKSSKAEKLHKVEKEVSKTSSSHKSGSSAKDKGSLKNSNQCSTKKDIKSHGKREDGKNRDKVKTSDTVQREGRDEKRSDAKLKSTDKVRTESGKQGRNTVESKKAKISDKEKDPSKIKDCHLKNGMLDGSKREKDMKKICKSSSGNKHSSSNSKSSSVKSKDKVKQNISSSNGKRPENKRPSRSLSHADLFGDESPEEVEPIEVDDEDEESEEVLIRKSADALKRGRLNKRKASELTPSSSDDEGDHIAERGKKEVTSARIDYSVFQDDLDLDSDPMEECLRIFNESKDVKKEDKGRQAKQVLNFSRTV